MDDDNLEALEGEIIDFIERAIKQGDEVAHPLEEVDLDSEDAILMALRCYKEYALNEDILEALFVRFEDLHGNMLIDIRTKWDPPSGRPAPVSGPSTTRGGGGKRRRTS